MAGFFRWRHGRDDQGEDYVNFAEHKGLSAGTIFRDYYLQQRALPQATGFALSVGDCGYLWRCESKHNLGYLAWEVYWELPSAPTIFL